MSGLTATIVSERLSLVVLTPQLLATMSGGDRDEVRPFGWPSWWPDETDQRLLAIWADRATESELNIDWGPRAVVHTDGEMVGHAGFHLPPASIERALADPTFVGRRDPVTSGGVVELGYTIFPIHRHRGFATEAAKALISWAHGSGDVGAVLAAVAADNTSSLRVLERVGGFNEIGTCRSDQGDLEVVYRRDITDAG